jgi:hypothetical protein
MESSLESSSQDFLSFKQLFQLVHIIVLIRDLFKFSLLN